MGSRPSLWKITSCYISETCNWLVTNNLISVNFATTGNKYSNNGKTLISVGPRREKTPGLMGGSMGSRPPPSLENQKLLYVSLEIPVWIPLEKQFLKDVCTALCTLMTTYLSGPPLHPPLVFSSGFRPSQSHISLFTPHQSVHLQS